MELSLAFFVLSFFFAVVRLKNVYLRDLVQLETNENVSLFAKSKMSRGRLGIK